MYDLASAYQDMIDSQYEQQRQEEIDCWFAQVIEPHECDGFFLVWLAVLLLLARDIEDEADIPF